MEDALTSLPNELLVRILAHLDDTELHRLILVCRTIHTSSLFIIFKRYIPGILQAQLTLNTSQIPTCLLPALHSALHVTDIQAITVKFDSPDLARFYEDIRLLTVLVEKVPRITTFDVDFTHQARRHGNLNTLELYEALKRLFNLVLDKECLTLTVHEKNGCWGTLNVVQTEKRASSLGLSKLLKPFGKLFRASPNFKGNMSGKAKAMKKVKGSDVKGDSENQPDEVGSSEIEPSSSPWFPYQKWSRDTFLNGRLDIYTEMFFHPPWLDWTLALFNSTALHTLNITAHYFSKDIWTEFLPMVYIPGLWMFCFTGDKITMSDLGCFLKRHAKSLTRISLAIPRLSVVANDTGVRQANGSRNTQIPPQEALEAGCFADIELSCDTSSNDPPGFYFPRMDCLHLTPFCIEWFFQNIMASPIPNSSTGTGTSTSTTHSEHNNPRARYRLLLPRLEIISIMPAYSTEPHAAFTGVDGALEILAQFLRSEPSNSEKKISFNLSWFDRLNFDTRVLGTRISHAQWFTSHSSRRGTTISPSPLYSFHTISNIRFHTFNRESSPSESSSGNSGSSEDRITTKAEFLALPGFLALFSGLKMVFWSSTVVDVVRGFDKEYWKGMKKSNPLLDVIYLNRSKSIWVKLDEQGNARIEDHSKWPFKVEEI